MNRHRIQEFATHARCRLGLFEACISLAIIAALLVGVSASCQAGISATRVNEEFFSASQAARVAMTQILADLRRADAVSVSTNRIDVVRPNGSDYGYLYSPSVKKLFIVTNDVTSDPDYVLATNVTSASFTAETEVRDSQTIVVGVSVTLEIARGKNSISLSGAAIPRRTRSFE